MVSAAKTGVHHVSAEELLRLGLSAGHRISLATVYRALLVFEQRGLVMRHQFGDQHHVYELAARGRHDHMIDVATGEVFEFDDEGVERLKQELSRKLGVKILRHTLTIFVDRE